MSVHDHVVRIDNAVNYIEQHLEQDLSLRVLADKAHYSQYHFHRVFSNLYRETPNQFVTRKRVEKILWLLLKQKARPIAEIISNYGFNSPVTFSKTFKKHYGISASEARKLSAGQFNKVFHKNSKIGKEKISIKAYFRSVDAIKKWMGAANPMVSCKNLQSQTLVAIRSQGGFELADIAFRNLRVWAQNEGFYESQTKRWVFIIHDNPAITEEGKIGHSACMKINKPFKGLHDKIQTLTIPGGTYLVGTFEIEDAEFQLAWGGMSVWLMEKGYQYRDGFYFEVFHDDSVFDGNAKYKVDICLPIQ